MKIAIIGAGNVGGTLGRRWSELGHDVTFGVRDGGGVKGGVPSGARVAAPPEAVRGAEVVVLATPWGVVAEAVAALGPLDGKVLIDCTNPIAPGFVVDEGVRHASGAERIAALAPGARVVKTLNQTGFANMANPVFGGEPSVMFVAGDDADAKAQAAELVRALGFEPIDAGALLRARELEHLAMLWIALSIAGHGREIAFRLVRR